MVGGAVNAALANFSKALAGQGLQDDVNVNWINPGQTETERLQQLLSTRARDENLSIDDVRAERMQAEGFAGLASPRTRRRLSRSCAAMRRAISMAPVLPSMAGDEGIFLMDFSPTEEQRLLVATIRSFVETELRPLEAQVEETGHLADELAAEIRAKSQSLGLYAVNIPTEYGGGGLSVLDWMIAEEQFGRTSDI